MKNLDALYEEWATHPGQFSGNYLGKRIRVQAQVFTLSYSEDDNFRLLLELFADEGQLVSLECFLSKPEFMKLYAAPFVSSVSVEGILETISDPDAADTTEDEEVPDLMEGLIYDAKITGFEVIESADLTADRLLRPSENLKILRGMSEGSPYDPHGACGHIYPADSTVAFWNVKKEAEVLEYVHTFYSEEKFSVALTPLEESQSEDEYLIDIACRRCTAKWVGGAAVLTKAMTGKDTHTTLRILTGES